MDNTPPKTGSVQASLVKLDTLVKNYVGNISKKFGQLYFKIAQIIANISVDS